MASLLEILWKRSSFAPVKFDGSMLGDDAAMLKTEPNVVERAGGITNDRPDCLCQFDKIAALD